MNPSGIRPSAETGYPLQQVRPGLYSVEDAYRGNYEFFKGRPMGSITIREISGDSLDVDGNSTSNGTKPKN